MLSILKASAGSGKTFALTYEYIRLLLGYKADDGRLRLNKRARDRHRHILAITFTNKATDEMKQRIVHELAVLAGKEPGWDEPSPYESRLTKEFGCSAADLHEAAYAALQQLLFDFSYFHVSTIDAFFQTILRTFAREAELDGNYELDLDTTNAIGYGVADLFSSMSADPDSRESKQMVGWISRYLLDEMRAGKSVNLFNRSSRGYEDLLDLIGRLSDEKFASHFEEMMNYLSTEKLIAFRKGVRREAEALREELRRSCLDALQAVADNPLPKGNVSANLLRQIQDCSETGFDDGSRKSARSVVDGKDFYTKAAAPYFKDGALAGLYNAVQKACHDIVELSARITVLDHLAGNMFIVGLLRGVLTRVEKFRNDNNTLLLSDTNSLLRKIIGDDDAPFVYERVGVDLRHFLIDEFQDTSKMQWEILRPLVNNSQSWDYDNLIIGDEKQCIYRFRSSDPTLLQKRVGEEVTHGIRVLGATAEENTNWRSSADVVEFNSGLFSSIAKLYGFEDTYANVQQNVSAKHTGHAGYIAVDILTEKATYDDEALSRMFAAIKRQIASGYRPCDIAVLTRFRNQAAKAIDYLVHELSADPELAPMGIRIISDDSMNIDSSPAVKRVVSVLRSVATGKRPESVADAGSERSDSRRTMAEFDNMVARYEFNVGCSMPPSEALYAAIAECAEALPPDCRLDSLLCENLPSMVERIVRFYFSGGKVDDGEMVYLLAFEDAVTDFCATAPVADIQSFIRWWDSVGHNTKLTASADANALRVMTVHKSKGLEFKCVYLPYVDWPMVRFKDLEWFEPRPVRGVPESLVPPLVPMRPMAAMRLTEYKDEYESRHRDQMLDELNVLYVAFTRAIDELVACIYVPAGKQNGKKEAESADDLKFSGPTAGEAVARALRAMGYDTEEVRRGEPTVAGGSEAKRDTAITPHATVEMPCYSVVLRDELLDNTRVETDVDTAFGRDRGNVLHDILADILTLRDVDRAVGKAVRFGLLPRPEADEVKARIRGAIDSVASRGWFDGFKRVLRERPIDNIVSRSGRRSSLRPDRVVWTADGHIDIIDYKFGREHDADYKRQVRGYIEAYRRLGYEGLRGFIWYVDLDSVVEI